MIAQRNIMLSPEVKTDLFSLNTLVLGSGGAALNGALHLFQFLRKRGVEHPEDWIAIVTDGLGLGTTRFSGSDKQTYYKLGTSSTAADSPRAFAETLTARGCMHGDLALIEAENSLREFYHLVDLGVPFPHTPEGGYIGYKTDHDPLERGTSAGPKTSGYMFDCLFDAVKRAGIPIFTGHELQELLTEGEGEEKRVIGAVTLNLRRTGEKDRGLTFWNAENVLAALGGPGTLYETSVYPVFQRGNHAALFRAGARAQNLTESQFGLASTKFRWNLSGTYQQVIPRYFSTDTNGNDAREFLNAYFPNMRKMATDIFLKGYQWPFDPQRLEDHRSALIDMLVFYEQAILGRRVFMDFLRNPEPGDGLSEFSLEDLEPEARTYLEKSGALQATPIERLEHMNPPAIDLYRENGIDLRREPLEIAVCSQHNNGGFLVNRWWESNVRHLFVAGELAGTHGIKRPGGSSLNSTQVGSMRAAEYIASRYANGIPEAGVFESRARTAMEKCRSEVETLIEYSGFSALHAAAVRKEIQERMTRTASQVRSLAAVREAVMDAKALTGRIEREGLRFEGPSGLADALFTRNMALTSLGYLEAIRALLERGSGSRGSHLVISPEGKPFHPMLPDEWKILPENESLRSEVLEVFLDSNGEFQVTVTPVRPIPEKDYWFETLWADFREGRIYDL